MMPTPLRLHPARISRLLLLALAGGPLAVGLVAANLPPGFRPLEVSDYQPARVSEHELQLRIDYPGSATNRGIGEGEAVVSAAVDAEGNATDFLVVDYTDRAFGQALIEGIKPLKFRPATLHGVAVPARCEVGYKFLFRSSTGSERGFGFSAWGSTTGGLSASALPVSLIDLDAGKQLPRKPALSPAAEKNLDEPLKFTDVCLPKLPAGYAAPEGKPVKAFVSFYIDEQGHVRQPRVESEVAPELAAQALRAVGQWSFKPPLAKGKPTLVLTARSVGFVSRTQ